MADDTAINLLNQGSLPASIAGGNLPVTGGASIPSQNSGVSGIPSVPAGYGKDPRVQMAIQEAQQQQATQDDIAKRKQAEMAPINQDIQKKTDDLGKMAETGPEKVALPENTARHLDQKQLSDSFSSFMALGALAGLLSKAPMTAALNNMTGAIKGVQEGDEQQYQQHYKEFQQNYQKAVDINKEKLEEYTKVFNNNKMSLDEKIRQSAQIANKYGDELVRAEASRQNYKGIQSALDASMKSMEHANDKKQELDHWHQEHEDKMKEHADALAHQQFQLDETKRFHDAEINHWATEAVNKSAAAGELKGVPPKTQTEFRGNAQIVDELGKMKDILSDPELAKKVRDYGIEQKLTPNSGLGLLRDHTMSGLTDDQKDKMNTYFMLDSRYRAGEFDKGGIQMTKIKQQILDPIYQLGGGYDPSNLIKRADESAKEFTQLNKNLLAEYPQFSNVEKRMEEAKKGTSSTINAIQTKVIGGVTYHQLPDKSWVSE